MQVRMHEGSKIGLQINLLNFFYLGFGIHRIVLLIRVEMIITCEYGSPLSSFQ